MTSRRDRDESKPRTRRHRLQRPIVIHIRHTFCTEPQHKHLRSGFLQTITVYSSPLCAAALANSAQKQSPPILEQEADKHTALLGTSHAFGSPW